MLRGDEVGLSFRDELDALAAARPLWSPLMLPRVSLGVTRLNLSTDILRAFSSIGGASTALVCIVREKR